MLHPIFSTVIQRPDLVLGHLSAYGALVGQEAKTAGAQLVPQGGLVKGPGGDGPHEAEAMPAGPDLFLRAVDPVVSERLHLLLPPLLPQ